MRPLMQMVGFKYWHGACQLLLAVFLFGLGAGAAGFKAMQQPKWLGLMTTHEAEQYAIQSNDSNTAYQAILPSLNDVVLAVMTTRHMMRDQLQTSPKISVEHRPEPTPLGALRFANGECVIVVNTNPDAWQKWLMLLQHSASTPLHAMLQTAAAHEMAHCMQIPGVQNAAPHTRGVNQLLSMAEQELLADVVALLFAAQHHNAYFESIQHTFTQTRMHLGTQESTHNHGMRLKSIAEQHMLEHKHDTALTKLNWVQMGLILMKQTTPQT